MSHDTHAAEVQDTLATRILGIALGFILFAGIYAFTTAKGWPPAVCSVLSGVAGVTFGAGGTSAHGGARAAIMGYIGAINFIMGLAIFLGLANWLF